MSPSLELNFGSGILSEVALTGMLPKDYDFSFNYGRAKEIHLQEGRVLVQQYSSYLFYIGFFELSLEKELKLSYVVKERSFILFLKLQGSFSIMFAERNGSSSRKDVSYVSYNREPVYSETILNKGIHRFCYIAARPEWLERKISQFPAIGDFVKSFRITNRQSGCMPRCLIDGKAYKALHSLFAIKPIKGVDTEAQILNRSIKLFELYNDMVSSGLYIHSDSHKERIRIVKQYIDENAKELKFGDIQVLAEKFFYARRTLTRIFKDETGFTIQEYIEKSKLESALKLLKATNLPIKEISRLSGYPDQNYFCRVFRKQYGSSPKTLR